MWKYIQNKALFSKTIALILVFCLAIPTTLLAQKALPKPVKLTEVQPILETFERNVPGIIGNANWKNNFDKLPMEWNLEGWSKQFPDTRFRMVQNTAGEFDLFIEKKKALMKEFRDEKTGYVRRTYDHKNTTWTDIFSGNRIGQVIYTKDKKAKFEPDFTTFENNEGYDFTTQMAQHGLRVEDADGSIHEDGAVSYSAQALKKQKDALSEQLKASAFEQVKLQCSAVLEDDDVRNRRLVEKVFGIQGKNSKSFTEQQLDQFEDEIEDAEEDMDTIESLNERKLDRSLELTIYSFLAYRDTYIKKRTSDEWIKHFFDLKNYPEYIMQHPKFKKSIPSTLAQYKVYGAKMTLPVINLYTEMEAFNKAITGVNATCLVARKECHASLACNNPEVAMSDGLGPVPAGERMRVYEYNKKISSAKSQLKEKYQPLLDAGIQKIQKNRLYTLWASEDFRDDVGTINIEECMTGDDELKFIDMDMVTEAIADVSDQYVEKIKEIIRDFNVVRSKGHMSGQVVDVMNKYMNSLPVTTMMTLEQSKNIHEAKVICGLIDDLYEDDQIEQYVDYGLMGIGFVAGIMLSATGVGAPAGISLMAKSTAGMATIGIVNAVVVGRGVGKALEGNRLEDQVSKGMITGEIGTEDAKIDLETHAARQVEGVFDVGGTVLGEGLGYIAGPVIRSGATQAKKGYNYVRTLKTQRAIAFFAKQDEAVTSTVSRTINQAKYTTAQQKEAFEILERAQTAGASNTEDVAKQLRDIQIDPTDANNLIYEVANLNEQKLIFEHIEPILTQSKYAGKEAKTMKILHGVSKNGYVREGSIGIFHNSEARDQAIKAAHGELVGIGYSAEDATKMLDDLYNPKTGVLRGKIRTTNTGQYADYARRGTGSQTVSTEGNSIFANRGVAQTINPHVEKQKIIAKIYEKERTISDLTDLRNQEVRTLIEEYKIEPELLDALGGDTNPFAIRLEDSFDILEKRSIDTTELRRIFSNLSASNDQLIDSVQKLLKMDGIESEIVVGISQKRLKLKMKPHDSRYQKVKNYFKDMTDTPEQYFDFVYDPYNLGFDSAGGAVRNQRELVISMESLEALMKGEVSDTVAHEFVHVGGVIERNIAGSTGKEVKSAFIHQKFKSNKSDLLDPKYSVYAESYSLEELQAYKVTLERELKNLKAAKTNEEFKTLINRFKNRLNTTEDLNISALKNSKEFLEAIENGIAKITSNLNGYGIEVVVNGKTYTKEFIGTGEMSIFSDMKNQSSFSFGDVTSEAVIKKLKESLIEINTTAYYQLIDIEELNRIGISMSEISASAPEGSLMIDVLSEELDAFVQQTERITAHVHNYPRPITNQIDEELIPFVIQRIERPSATTSYVAADMSMAALARTDAPVQLHPGLQELRDEALFNHPGLQSIMVDQAAHDIQAILDDPKYWILKPEAKDEAVKILKKVHKEGVSTLNEQGVMVAEVSKKRALQKAEDELVGLGYSREDAGIMVRTGAHDNVRMFGKVKDQLPDLDVLKSAKSTAEYHQSSVQVFEHPLIMKNELQIMSSGSSGIIYEWNLGEVRILRMEKYDNQIRLYDVESGKELDIEIFSGDEKAYQFVNTTKHYNPNLNAPTFDYYQADPRDKEIFSKMKADMSVETRAVGKEIDDALKIDKISVEKIRKSKGLGNPGNDSLNGRVKLYVTKKGEKFIIKRGDMSNLKADKAAYIVSEKMGFGFVPQSSIIEIDGLIFSVQRFVDDGIEGGVLLTSDVNLFDFLIANVDRTPERNIFQLPNGRIVLFDNEMSFGNFDIKDIFKWFKDSDFRNMSKEELHSQMRTNSNFMNRLTKWTESDIRTSMAGLLTPGEIELMIQRRTYLLSHFNG